MDQVLKSSVHHFMSVFTLCKLCEKV